MTQLSATETDAFHGCVRNPSTRTTAIRIVRFDRMGRPKADSTITVDEILNAPPLVTWRRNGVVAAMAIPARTEMTHQSAL